jgi:exodeoxyribonuclease VII small subunit
MTTEKINIYKDLQSKLNQILGSLESDATSIDEVGNLLKQGFETVDALRARLTAAEAQIDNIIALRHQSLSATNAKENQEHGE